MLSMIGVVLISFFLLVRASYRRERLRRAEGRVFAPEGRVRWDERGVVEGGARRG